MEIKNSRGFTVLEIIVISGIAVMLAAIGIPYIRKYQPNLKLNAAARELTSDLRLAQQYTITEQNIYELSFDLENDSYEILKTGSATTSVKTVTLDSDLSWKSIIGLTGNVAVFNFYGGVAEAGEVSIANSNGREAVINIKPSGYIQLE